MESSLTTALALPFLGFSFLILLQMINQKRNKKRLLCCYSMPLLIIMSAVMLLVAFAPVLLDGVKGNGFVSPFAMISLTSFYIIAFYPLIKSNYPSQTMMSVSQNQLIKLIKYGKISILCLIIPFLCGIKKLCSTNHSLGFDKLELMKSHNFIDIFLLFLACFSKVSMFIGLYLFFFTKQKKISIILLALSLTDILLNIDKGGRSKMTSLAFFTFNILLYFYYYSQKKRKIFCVIVFGFLIFIPYFLYISYYRFPDNFWSELCHYIIAGPYFFNLDYQILFIEEAFFPLGGVSTFPLLKRTIFPFLGIDIPDIFSDFLHNEEIRSYYWYTGAASQEEFKTILGAFIVDFHKWYYIVYLFPLFFIIFLPKQNDLTRCLHVTVYSYLLLFSFIGYPFASIYGNIELLLLLLLRLLLREKKKKILEPNCAVKCQDLIVNASKYTKPARSDHHE